MKYSLQLQTVDRKDVFQLNYFFSSCFFVASSTYKTVVRRSFWNFGGEYKYTILVLNKSKLASFGRAGLK